MEDSIEQSRVSNTREALVFMGAGVTGIAGGTVGWLKFSQDEVLDVHSEVTSLENDATTLQKVEDDAKEAFNQGTITDSRARAVINFAQDGINKSQQEIKSAEANAPTEYGSVPLQIGEGAGFIIGGMVAVVSVTYGARRVIQKGRDAIKNFKQKRSKPYGNAWN